MSKPVQPVPPLPVLQKPPGYRDPNATPPIRPGPPNPPKHKPILPSSVYDYDHKKKCGKRATCCSCCCSCLCLSLFILLLVLATLFGFFYLSFSPKFPVFHLRSFRVTNLTVTPATKDGISSVNVCASTVVEVRNPNSKLLIYYGRSDINMRLTAGGKEVRFSEKRVEGFRQSKGNVTRLKVENTVKDAVVGGTLRDKLKKKEATVEVTVNTSVGVEFWGLKVGKVGVKVDCGGGGGGVKLKDIEGGGVMPKCAINTLKWINIH